MRAGYRRRHQTLLSVPQTNRTLALLILLLATGAFVFYVDVAQLTKTACEVLEVCPPAVTESASDAAPVISNVEGCSVVVTGDHIDIEFDCGTSVMWMAASPPDSDTP